MEIATGLEREICERLHILSDKIDGGKIGYNYGESFNNGIFEMNDYYWGNCTCGYEELEEDWTSRNFHKDFCYQVDYDNLLKVRVAERSSDHKFLSSLSEQDLKDLYRKHRIKWNDGAGAAIHCTCDYDRILNNFMSVYDHKIDCRLLAPNFKYMDFEICWYKYIGRGMEYSREISRKEISEIFDSCEESLNYVRIRT